MPAVKDRRRGEGGEPTVGPRGRGGRKARTPSSAFSFLCSRTLSPPRRLLAIGALLLAALLLGAWYARRHSVAPSPPLPSSPRLPEEEARLRETAARQPGAAAPRRELARYYEREGRRAEALWAWQEAASAAPGEGAERMALAVALGRLGLHDAAIEELRELLRSPSPPKDAPRALAEFCLATGRLEEARAAMAGAAGTGDGASLLTSGRVYLALGRYHQAIALFRRSIEQNPQRATGHLWLGAALAGAGRDDEARAAWRRAQAAAPEDPEALYRLARLEAAGPGETRALEILEEALRRDPSYAPALKEQGRLLLRKGHAGEALAAFEAVGRAAPGDPEAYAGQAAALRALGRAEEARRLAGLAEAVAGRPARAVAEFRAYLAARPEDPERVQLLAQAWIQMRENVRAAALVAEALRRHPADRSLRETLATLYLMTLSLAEARQVCEEWLRREPEAARPRWLLGRAASAGGRPEEARRFFEEALAREPGEAAYAASLGDLLARSGDPESRPRALALLRQAVERAPESAEYRLRLATALAGAGEWEAARDAYLAALSRDPSLSAPYSGLVQAAQRLGRPDQVALWARAQRLVQERSRAEDRLRRRIRERPEDPQATLDLARELLRRGDPRAARAQLEEALRIRPAWPPARDFLARVTALQDAL